MEWSRPTQQGEIPSPRAGHAGVAVGENWFIVGGGNNKSGMLCSLRIATAFIIVPTVVYARIFNAFFLRRGFLAESTILNI